MGKVIVIGEALIDFIPNEINTELKNVSGFTKAPGGAPANVAACVKRLGGCSQIITKLGQDAFGDFLVEKMDKVGINCLSVLRTNVANTALAFVSLRENGERDFAFYRNPSADMLLEASEIKDEWFDNGDILHFCSVDLIDAPVRAAHDKAIAIAKRKNIPVSFDPNVRLPLWSDTDEYRQVINQYIPIADILKISDNELSFITGINNEKEAIRSLMEKVKILIYTKGSSGAEIFTKNSYGSHQGYLVNAVDTTGAGDTFIGSFLYQLIVKKGCLDLNSEELCEMAAFSNAAAAIVTTRHGALESMPCLMEIEIFMQENINYKVEGIL